MAPNLNNHNISFFISFSGAHFQNTVFSVHENHYALLPYYVHLYTLYLADDLYNGM